MTPDIREQKGIVLIAIYLVITVVALITAAFFWQSYNENKQAERHQLSVKALALAEAGIESAIYDLREDYEADPNTGWSDGDVNGFVCGPDAVNFVTIPYPAAISQVGEGSFSVGIKNDTDSGLYLPDKVWVRSTGTVGTVTRTITTYINVVNVNIWDNAIFAGSGQPAGVTINGNVDIRGSVHILGESLNPGDLAMNLSGSAKIGNNYAGIPAEFSNRIPALPQTTFGGETVDTLYAKLRVKKGDVGLSGTGTVGELDVPGAPFDKETIDRVYVNDDYVGTAQEANVYSDNGPYNPYDLGDALSFPRLSDPHPNPLYATYQDYLRANAIVVDQAADLTELNSITPASTFSFGDPDTPGSNGIRMQGGVLTVNGIVYVEGGDLAMDKQGANKLITYEGRGTIVVVDSAGVGGDIDIQVDLLTDDVGPTAYPIDNIVGFITPNSISFNNAQTDVMGIFYGEDVITANKQTRVAGAFVSDWFNMGNQVPCIFQILDMQKYLPPGMIGASPVWYVQIVAWKEE